MVGSQEMKGRRGENQDIADYSSLRGIKVSIACVELQRKKGGM